MAKTSVDIPQLKFNKMSTAKYEELKLAGQLNNNEFYITPDGGTIPEVNETTNDFVLSNNGTDLNWVQETEYTKNRIDSKLNDNIRTNCLTKIPQDIKLELVDGFIYVKAGSKIYFPDGKEEDGTNKFKEVILSDDIKSSQAGTDSNVLVLIDPELTVAKTVSPSANFSGDTDPNTQAYSVWYDTSTNYIKHMPSDLSGYISGFSFPVCVENQTDGLIESITQIFNGFGYIGSTVFALPGVEGIIPNGRNVDGSLNNIKFTTTNVLLTGQFSGDFDAQIVMSGNDIGSYYYSYDDYNNLVRRTDTNEIYNGIILGNVSGKNNILTSLKPKNVFQLIDRNEADYIIESKINSDGSWYRKYKSGWLEQGGFDDEGNVDYGEHTITFQKSFANSLYTLIVSGKSVGNTSNASTPLTMLGGYALTTTNFKRRTSIETYRDGIYWYACGQGA